METGKVKCCKAFLRGAGIQFNIEARKVQNLIKFHLVPFDSEGCSSGESGEVTLCAEYFRKN